MSEPFVKAALRRGMTCASTYGREGRSASRSAPRRGVFSVTVRRLVAVAVGGALALTRPRRTVPPWRSVLSLPQPLAGERAGCPGCVLVCAARTSRAVLGTVLAGDRADAPADAPRA